MNDLKPPNGKNDPGPHNLTEDTARSAHRINETLGKSREVLASANTVFPFTLFPHTATIDREKLTIAHRFFFRTAEVTTIRIEDILNVTADVGPWFGALKVHSRYFNIDKPEEISFLRRADAMRFKRILQGYVIAIQKKIDCSRFTAKQLTTLLEELGQGGPADQGS